MQTLPRHPKTSEPSAPERKAQESRESHYTSKDVNSTESSKISWHKVETSQEGTELAVKVSTEENSQTRTSQISIQEGESSLWLMQDQAQMDLNSSCASWPLHISTEDIVFSAKFPEEWKFLTRLRIHLSVKAMCLNRQSASQTVDSFEESKKQILALR